ncbi:uncharacterized protein A4U43_C04F19420 [Asparagus officinalis]|uniref:Uncharacterized protein n=1 Tax=Asparagus officinalis TaxID=4686 RepID=A0A5P1F4V1_ASPOF|nr:uncharacterized protein LOC109837591 [Asparagus officinalis]ONK72437.1 uncharacterized protein A4U43_C04F19420 [Asparagus officinalis]
MASTILLHLQNFWPFSILKSDDLKLSNQLVGKLSIPEQTKQFVFAVREPDSNVVVYILAAQNLSEQSAIDAGYLIKEIQPKAVVVQVASSALDEIQLEEKNLKDDQVNNIPTSSFGVLRRCLTDKINKDQYDKFAGCQVLQEIFGIGLYGHFFAAKRASEEVGSRFLLLESPYESANTAESPGTIGTGDISSALNLQPARFLPRSVKPSVSSSHRFFLTDALQSQMVKVLTPSLKLSLQDVEAKKSESESIHSTYEAPQPFAQSVYPLLADLHDIFNELPAIRKAFVSAQEMLASINLGKPVGAQLLSEVHNFRIAIEGLRIALNNAAHCPINKVESGKSESKVEFSELSPDEKCHVLFAQALRSQASKFGGPIVAIVDAARLADLRKHWTTAVPSEIADLAGKCLTRNYSNENVDDYDDDDDDDIVKEQHTGKKRLLSDKPMVAVGAGATAVIGATSLSKAVPASTVVKITTYKVPAILKFSLASLKRQTYMGLSKILGPSKLLAPGVASGGTKTSATLKFTASGEKIRAVAHSMIASAERTSLLAIRTSFYEIMRRRHIGTFRVKPWATFGCSVATCSGLLMYGDRIECVAESVPWVPTIASMGRGLQSLQQASQEVKETSSVKIKEALQSLMYNLKKK